MKFQRNAIAFTIAATFTALFVVTMVAAWLFNRVTQSTQDDQFGLMKSIIEFNMAGAEDRAIARAEMLVSIPKIRDLFAAQEREALLQECNKMFEIQRDKYGVEQAQFHLAPAVSFLRLNAPDKFGDDLSSFRPMVVTVNKDKTLRKGVGLSRSGPGVFGVVPVFDSTGQHIGSFEIGINLGSVLDKLKAAYGLESATFIDGDMLKNIATGLKGDIFNEKNLVGKYLKYHSTNWDLVQNLVDAGDLASLEDKLPYTRTSLDNPYGVIIVPLRNGAGVAFGAIALAKNFGESTSMAHRSILILITISAFSFIIAVGAITFILRGGLVRPLNALVENFKALADGNHDAPTVETDKLYTELQSLAHEYERLRNQAIENKQGN